MAVVIHPMTVSVFHSDAQFTDNKFETRQNWGHLVVYFNYKHTLKCKTITAVEQKYATQTIQVSQERVVDVFKQSALINERD